MWKGILQLEIMEIESEHFKDKSYFIDFKTDQSAFILPVSHSPTKIEQSRYISPSEELEIKLYEDEKDSRYGYFKLPLTKLYDHPHKSHEINVNCVWM